MISYKDKITMFAIVDIIIKINNFSLKYPQILSWVDFIFRA